MTRDKRKSNKKYSSSSSSSSKTRKSIYQEHVSDGELDLSMTNQSSLSIKDLVALPQITVVDISLNQLTHLPHNFGMLHHLVSLDLSKNALEELPESFGDLINLSKLDLLGNSLRKLPLSFGNLKSLRWLDLNKNPWDPEFIPLDIAINPSSDTSDKERRQCAKRVCSYIRERKEQAEMLAEKILEDLTRQKAKSEAKKRRNRARRERQREGSTASSNTISSGPQQHGAISGDDNHAQTLHDPNDDVPQHISKDPIFNKLQIPSQESFISKCCFPLLMSIAGVLVVIKVFELHSVLRDSVLKMLFD
eukprot:gene4775-8665_t